MPADTICGFLLSSSAVILLEWVVVLTFLYAYRVLRVFYLLHAYLIVVPCYFVILWQPLRYATGNLVLGILTATILALAVERYVHQVLGPDRAGGRGVLLSLALFFMAAALAGLLDLPLEIRTLPGPVSLGTGLGADSASRHSAVASAIALLYPLLVAWILTSKKGLHLRCVSAVGDECGLHGIPVDQYRVSTIFLVTAVGGLAMLGHAGVKGVTLEAALPLSIVAMIVYLATGGLALWWGDLSALALIAARWWLSGLGWTPSGSEFAVLYAAGGLMMILVRLRRPPGATRVDCDPDPALAAHRGAQVGM